MERVKGIEPSSLAWKAIALPLSYTRLLAAGALTGLGPVYRPDRPYQPWLSAATGGGGRTRTYEGVASGFTVRPLCHSGHSSVQLASVCALVPEGMKNPAHRGAAHDVSMGKRETYVNPKSMTANGGCTCLASGLVCKEGSCAFFGLGTGWISQWQSKVFGKVGNPAAKPAAQ